MKEIEYTKPESSVEENTWLQKKKPIGAIPTVRTFRADVQELIKEKGTTKTDIALAEADRREARGEKRFPVEDESHLGRTILVLLLVLAFGLGVGGYALVGTRLNSFLGNNAATSTQPTPTIEDIEVNITDSPQEQVLADISIAFGKTFLPTGDRRTIVFVKKDGNGGMRGATKEEFFASISSKKVPNTLLVSLDNQFSYQVYSTSTLAGIITLGSRSYPNTFASLLDWEPEMAETLIPALNPFYNRKSIRDLYDRKFKDEQYAGVAIRTLYDLDGDSVLSYGFVDKHTLVIAGKSDAVRSVIDEEVAVK